MLLQNTVISAKAFLGELKKLSNLCEILEKDNQKVVPLEGNGLCFRLRLQYDMYIDPEKLIEFISKEVCTHLEYTKYMRVPLMAFHSTKNYSRVVADVYLSAILSALDLHIRTIQKSSGFYGVVNIYPLGSFSNKETVTLIVIDGIYQPVVQTKWIKSCQQLHLHLLYQFRCQVSTHLLSSQAVIL